MFKEDNVLDSAIKNFLSLPLEKINEKKKNEHSIIESIKFKYNNKVILNFYYYSNNLLII